MRVYHDPVTGDVTSTFNGPDDLAPPGTYIEVADMVYPTLSGLKVQGGAVVMADLTATRAGAIGRINARAGDVRKTFVTDLPGQQMLYLAKEAEARAYVADPAPDMADYTLMSAEIGAGLTAPDAWSLAQLWLNMGAQWRQVAGLIETARLGAVYAIEAAPSEPVIAAIEAAYEEALP